MTSVILIIICHDIVNPFKSSNDDDNIVASLEKLISY